LTGDFLKSSWFLAEVFNTLALREKKGGIDRDLKEGQTRFICGVQ